MDGSTKERGQFNQLQLEYLSLECISKLNTNTWISTVEAEGHIKADPADSQDNEIRIAHD